MGSVKFSIAARSPLAVASAFMGNKIVANTLEAIVGVKFCAHPVCGDVQVRVGQARGHGRVEEEVVAGNLTFSADTTSRLLGYTTPRMHDSLVESRDLATTSLSARTSLQ